MPGSQYIARLQDVPDLAGLTPAANGMLYVSAYASGTATWAYITTVNSAVLGTSAGGVPSWVTTLPDGVLSPNVPLKNAANTFTASNTITKAGIGVTSTDAHTLENTTAAAVGVQQWSPRLHFAGQGWKTTATAASQTVDWIVENQTSQSTTNPIGKLVFSTQVNGGGYQSMLMLAGGNGVSGNDTTLYGAGQANSLVIKANDGTYFNAGTGYIAALNWQVRSDTKFGWSANTTVGGASEFMLGRAAANVMYLRGDSGASVAPTFEFQGKSDTTSGRKVGTIAGVWATATDASRIGRIVFNASTSAADFECCRIVADATRGYLVVGGQDAEAAVQQFQIRSNASNGFLVDCAGASAPTAPQLIFQRARGTLASRTTTSAGDTALTIQSRAADSAGVIRTGAQLKTLVEGTPGSGGVLLAWVFATTDGTNTTQLDRLRISNEGVYVGIPAAAPGTPLLVNSLVISRPDAGTTATFTFFDADGTPHVGTMALS